MEIIILETNSQITGVLLVNLGTPRSPVPRDVFRYLNEFLTDARVIDLPWLKRQLLVRGIIVPARYRQSAKLYQKLWTKEGSPLLVHGKEVKEKLQAMLGENYKVTLAMRYQEPSISQGLEELRRQNISRLIVFPLFPQYASATTGSVHQKVMEIVQHWQVIPHLTFINSYPEDPQMIEAFCARGRQYPIDSFDHILFSFHGLPEKHIQKADVSKQCLTGMCCKRLDRSNQFCYKAQCEATARAIAAQMNLEPAQYTICFQSRLGKDPWIIPFTSQVIHDGAKKGWKRVLVFCPSFVSDCLETTCEISYEYNKEFIDAGGEGLQLVEGLNSHSIWVKALHTIVLKHSYL